MEWSILKPIPTLTLPLKGREFFVRDFASRLQGD
jgi:hypothetical protein